MFDMISFSDWLLSENMTVTQLLKNPKHAQFVARVRKEVIAYTQSVLAGAHSNFISRVANWFIKEMITQGVQPEMVSAAIENMWENVGAYIQAHPAQLLNKLNLADYNYQQMIQENDDWHDQLAAKQRGKGAEGRTLVPLDDVPGFQGWKWIARDQGGCSKEGDAMGHCGNGSGAPGDNLYSLRDPEGYPHLTFINNHGILGEMKGRGNSKPAPKYHPAIVKLLLSPDIGAVAGGGYAQQNNFNLKDLPPETQELVRSQKPYIDDVEGFKENRAKILAQMKAKARGEMLKKRSQSLRGLNADNSDQTMSSLASPDSYAYRTPKVYDQEYVQEPPPEVVHKNDLWKMYTELLNSVYSRARSMHPDQLFQWMDQMIESFVKTLVARDQKTWDDSPPNDKQFFPHLSNIVKLDEMVYRLMQEQPAIMKGAPTRSKFASWTEYMQGLGRYLNAQGYEAPSYRPTSHQISYEFNRKVAEVVVRQGQGIGALVNQALQGMDPRLSAIAMGRHEFTKQNPKDFYYGNDPSERRNRRVQLPADALIHNQDQEE